MKKVFLLILGIVILTGCAGPSYKSVYSPVNKGVEAGTPVRDLYLFEEGKTAFQKNALTKALEKFDAFLKKNPASSLTDDAMFFLGEIYLKRENSYEAQRYFQKIVERFPGSNHIQEALYGQAYCWFRLEDIPRSLDALEKLEGSFTLTGSLYVRVQTLRGHICLHQKKIVCGVDAYLAALSKAKTRTERDILTSFLEKAVSATSDSALLKELIDTHASDIAGKLARLRLAEVYLHEDAFGDAKKLVTPDLAGQLPDTARARAHAALVTLNRHFIRKIALGCLLPLSGKWASFGKRALKGLLLATEAFSDTPEEIAVTLFVKDTAGTPAGMGEKTRELIEKNHVQAIIGPMFLDTTRAAAEALRASPVPLISLSQAKDVPDLGNGIFRNCLTAEQQVQRLVTYLVGGRHFTTAAILYPKTPLGQRYMRLFWKAFTTAGGEIRGAETYAPDDTDFAVPIKKLVGLYYKNERWQRGDTPLETKDNEKTFAPVIDFEALFIPDIYNRIVLIAPQVAFHDILGVTLAGINTWNAPELLKEGGRFVRGAVFTDGFSRKLTAPFVKKFVTGFEATFDEKPEILAAQAYDAARLIVSISKTFPVKTPQELTEKLTTDTGYHGVSGLRYFETGGEAVRDVLVLTVARKGIMPAPPPPQEQEGTPEKPKP